jgi:two-component system phosphate regulon sensor histidine kinase PhoR
VVDDCVQAFAPLRLQHPLVELKTDVAPGLPSIYVDRAAMVDAIGNLLGNAVKYGGEPPVVTLRARKIPAGIAVEVTDNGEGIPRGEHRRIFDKFYRIDDRLSREREGSGLGLAIVKHIVRAHRGRVQVDSAPGKGSTFRIVLPVAPEKTEVLAHARAEAKRV